MIAVTFNSNPAFLLDDAPSWTSAVQIEAALPASYERGLTGRETRRLTGDTLRLSVKYSALLNGYTAITNLRNNLQDLSTQAVLCPFWPGLTQPSATPAITAAFYVLLDDTAAPSVQPASNAPFSRVSYPLCVGRLNSIPDPTLINDTLASVEFDFVENDNTYSLTPATFTPPTGLAAGSGTPPLFPFSPNWATPPRSGTSENDVSWQSIGALRAQQSQYFTQRSRRRVTQSFTLQNLDGQNLLRFFLDRSGEAKAFWLPAGISESQLTANVASSATTLSVVDGSALSGNNFLLLDDLVNRVPVKVNSVSGNTLTLSGAIGTAFTAATTRVESLILARFDALKISVAFTRPDLAVATIAFKELPWELTTVSGETIGTTMGALPATAMLYKFTLTIPSSPTVWYFTSFERSLSDGTHSWVSQPFDNTEITETDNLERQSVTIKSRNFSGNPLALLLPFQLEWPLLVEIYEGDVSGNSVSNLRCYFAGEVGTCDSEPPFISVDCASMSSIFERTIPRRLYQANCNWVLFESNCGLDIAAWTWTAAVVSYNASTSTLIVGTITSSNGATLAAHFFFAGYVQITTAGVKQSRMVSDNLAISGGQVTLYLAQPLLNAPSAGDVVKMFPGCDGQRTTCNTKFSNYSRFGGFPFMPVGNPSVLRVNTNQGGGGKK
jgi:uncharacterized phage protein (TIGR02218 family)